MRERARPNRRRCNRRMAGLRFNILSAAASVGVTFTLLKVAVAFRTSLSGSSPRFAPPRISTSCAISGAGSGPASSKSILTMAGLSNQRLGVRSRNCGARHGRTSGRINGPHTMMMISPEVANVISGSVGGAIGVGVSFPLDTLKTKAQVMAKKKQRHQQLQLQPQLSTRNSDGSVVAAAALALPRTSASEPSMAQTIRAIWREEGLGGFFGGVQTMMVGQALSKAVAFSANAYALSFLHQHFQGGGTTTGADPFDHLVAAACFSGFVASFVMSPVERIKVLMQAGGSSKYANEMDCARSVLRNEGLGGLLGRGLGTTMARGVPSYAIYFVAYGVLMHTALASAMGGAAPVVFGALSGCGAWIPVYPIDVVKTLAQNSDGGGGDDGDTGDIWAVAQSLYEEGGVGAFFDGLTPKLLMAAVNHAVTFWTYDLSMHSLSGIVS